MLVEREEREEEACGEGVYTFPEDVRSLQVNFIGLGLGLGLGLGTFGSADDTIE